MKKLLLGLGVATMASTGIVTVAAARHEPTIRPNSLVAGVNLGGLTVPEAQLKLRIWWEDVRVKKLTLKGPYPSMVLPAMSPGQLGVTIDDVATVAKLEKLDFVEDLTNRTFPDQASPVVFKPSGLPLTPLVQEFSKQLPETRAARVGLVKGAIIRVPEVGSVAIDEQKLPTAVEDAVLKGASEVTLPVHEAEKRVPDSELAKIKEVVSTFTTHFPLRRNRIENIRVAASKLNGIVLLPGERLSFNKTVGKRTIEAGFKEAPVFVNGKHDLGIGGGICQVSTTLYNAALFADLAIKQRRNHSMPVPYVPVGRDATVDYPRTDLVIENSMATPIGVVCHYVPGTLSFSILGQKVPGQVVKIERAPVKTWSAPVRKVADANLELGKTKVVERGTSGKSTSTTRIVILNGVVVKRESLGRSYYAGGSRVIATGTKPAGSGATPVSQPQNQPKGRTLP